VEHFFDALHAERAVIEDHQQLHERLWRRQSAFTVPPRAVRNRLRSRS
jgi:hypothetical protein